MTRKEAAARTAAPLATIQGHPPTAFVFALTIFVESTIRLVVYLSVALATCLTAGISLWWAPVLAWLLSATVGRAWSWLRRPAYVEWVERTADAVPKEKK